MIISTRSVLLKLWRYIGTQGGKDRVNLFSCRLNLSFVSIFYGYVAVAVSQVSVFYFFIRLNILVYFKISNMFSKVGLNIFFLIPNYFFSYSSASAVAIRQANTVNTIFGLTSTKSSGRA